MSADGSIATQHSTVVEAANRLLPLLAEIDQLEHRQIEMLRKSEKLAEQMLTLARMQARGWSDKRQVELTRLDASARSLQVKMGAIQRSMHRLRRQFEASIAKFRVSFVHHDNQLADFQIGHGRMTRENAALDRVVRHLVRSISAKSVPADSEKNFEVPEDSHDYIAIGIPYFMEMQCRLDGILTLDPDYEHPTQRYRPISFLEVGSGSGRNMMLVHTSEILLCERVHGFDFNPDLIREGEQIFDLGGNLEVADAMSYDYGGFDILFSYRPFSNLKMQKQLEARMVETMSPSSYLVAPLFFDLSLYPTLTPVDSRGDIWKKIG
ncbi:MAG: class I SAM-dependent methyltransferase [Paracoccaceae bacterium]